MSNNISKLETPVDPKTGDKPADVPGHVIPGADLRRRMGLNPTELPKSEEEVTGKKSARVQAEDETKAKEVAEAAAKKVTVRKHTRTIHKPEPAAAAAAMTPKEIAEIANEVVKAGQKTAMEAAKPVEPELTPKQKRDHAVLKRIEESNPARAGVAAKYLDSQKKFAAYKSAWELEHKGEAFNPEAAEHEAFVSANEVTYDQDEYMEALADIKAEERTAKAMEPITKKFETEEQQRKQQARVAELVPKIVTHQKTTALVFFNQMGDDFKGVLDDGGTLVVDKMKTLTDANPATKRVFGLAEQTEKFAGQVMAIAAGLAMFDEKSPLDREIFEFANKQEAAMQALPDEKRVNENGQEFCTAADYAKMNAAQRKDYWTLSDTDLSALYAVEKAAEAKKIIEDDAKEFNARLIQMGYKPQPTSYLAQLNSARPAPVAPAPAVPAPPPTPATADDDFSPSGVVAPRMAQVRPQLNTSTKSLLQRLTS